MAVPPECAQHTVVRGDDSRRCHQQRRGRHERRMWRGERARPASWLFPHPDGFHRPMAPVRHRRPAVRHIPVRFP